jgi:very-short-patch-repair endonuclease
MAIRAIELGGRLGGASALSSHGIWVDDDESLHVACSPHASRLAPLRSGERRIWVKDVFPQHRTAQPWRVSVLDALLQLALVAPRDSLIASIDSALERKRIGRRDVIVLTAALPERLRLISREIDGSAMSGTETHMRLALVRAGHRVEPQASVARVGSVDLLVDGWLIVEVDSKKHHDGDTNQHRDRTRDGNSVLGGYGHERFVWRQVYFDIDWCMSVVETRLRDGRPRA